MDPDAYTFHKLPRTPRHQFKGHPIISDQVGQGELQVVWRELEQVLTAQIPGDITEFGCYAGTTSLFIRRLLDSHGESNQRSFHVYDSFQGLPPKHRLDQSSAGTDFQPGKLSVSKKDFLHEFKAAGLHPPTVHKGWFSQVTVQDVPEHIALAFLDGDFYDSILDSLKLVWPRMSPGGVVLIDDYKREALPGVERAIADFFRPSAMPPIRAEHNVAIIRKK